ncbi:MAG: transposase, partial [Nitrososphaera sp.]|nr:transposase [Nitrososphaera sp.]
MIPIVDIPLVVRNFCSQLKGVFTRIEQRDHFEAFVTALSVSENKTIAGVHQQLFNGPTYESLHNYMSGSPWSVEKLQETRLQYVKQQMVKESEIKRLTPKSDTTAGAELSLSEKQFPRVVAIDASFIHHTGEKIYGVYWFWDYAKRCYTLAQRIVISTLVTQEKLVPLGWKLYHRGFLEEQKVYLEEAGPEPDSDEAAWAEYDRLIETYETNQQQHKTQNELAVELVDECEQIDLSVDAYVCDGALACPEIMDAIEKHGKAWVSKLAKSRLVQTAAGGFEPIEAFARAIPEESYKPINVETRHGESRTYWCFSKCLMVHKWRKLRVVIS